MTNNIFYFNQINKIGGTEQYLYEIAKKYNYLDITIYYDNANRDQLKRLMKYIRCIKRTPGQKVYCKKAFYNFTVKMIDDVEAEEHIYVDHAIFQVLGYEPNEIKHSKLTKVIAVSEYAESRIQEFIEKFELDLPTEVTYNPLTLENIKKPKIIVAACRLDDKVKGGERTLNLIKEMDKFCNESDEHYIFLIFSNPISFKIDSPNVVLMKPRVDIRPYIAMADYVVQLSDDMETYGYTINEALGYGVPVITTPLSVMKEFRLTNDMGLILDWDCSNVSEVVNRIFNKPHKKFKYNLPKDNWNRILVPGKNTYDPKPDQIVEVECICLYTDLVLKKDITPGTKYNVTYKRVLELLDLGEDGVIRITGGI